MRGLRLLQRQLGGRIAQDWKGRLYLSQIIEHCWNIGLVELDLAFQSIPVTCAVPEAANSTKVSSAVAGEVD